MVDAADVIDNEPIESNTILVALTHLALVQDTLSGSFGVQSREVDRDAALGLVKLKLLKPDEIAGGSTSSPRSDLVLPAALPGGTPSPADDYYDVGRILRELRKVFEDRFLGWYPPMGKNRTVAQTIERGVIIRTADEGNPPNVPGDLPLWLTSPRLSGPGRDVVVGLADTVFAPQRWMDGAWVARYSDRQWGPLTTWQNGHSTFLAGLILSQAPGATIDARCVLGDDGTGSSWEVAKKIMKFSDSEVDILNLSFGAFTGDNQPPLAIKTAIEKLSPNIVVVAAAGNHGRQDPATHENVRPLYPAALPGVVAVGSATGNGTLADFSPPAEWVDVIADGESLVSLFPAGTVRVQLPKGPVQRTFDGYAEWSGTSFSAALISGAIAAGTQRGRISARQSWENMREQLPKRPRTSPALSAKSVPTRPAPYLRLDL